MLITYHDRELETRWKTKRNMHFMVDANSKVTSVQSLFACNALKTLFRFCQLFQDLLTINYFVLLAFAHNVWALILTNYTDGLACIETHFTRHAKV